MDYGDEGYALSLPVLHSSSLFTATSSNASCIAAFSPLRLGRKRDTMAARIRQNAPEIYDRISNPVRSIYYIYIFIFLYIIRHFIFDFTNDITIIIRETTMIILNYEADRSISKVVLIMGKRNFYNFITDNCTER